MIGMAPKLIETTVGEVASGHNFIQDPKIQKLRWLIFFKPSQKPLEILIFKPMIKTLNQFSL